MGLLDRTAGRLDTTAGPPRTENSTAGLPKWNGKTSSQDSRKEKRTAGLVDRTAGLGMKVRMTAEQADREQEQQTGKQDQQAGKKVWKPALMTAAGWTG